MMKIFAVSLVLISLFSCSVSHLYINEEIERKIANIVNNDRLSKRHVIHGTESAHDYAENGKHSCSHATHKKLIIIIYFDI